MFDFDERSNTNFFTASERKATIIDLPVLRRSAENNLVLQRELVSESAFFRVLTLIPSRRSFRLAVLVWLSRAWALRH
ncbi:MAG TPA: hypothetical protein PK435_15865, partial [Thermoanaerobaculaceae bacterium]|nr:hypothetical protein [Thermoanaerobaculaceae bacterium]